MLSKTGIEDLRFSPAPQMGRCGGVDLDSLAHGPTTAWPGLRGGHRAPRDEDRSPSGGSGEPDLLARSRRDRSVGDRDGAAAGAGEERGGVEGLGAARAALPQRAPIPRAAFGTGPAHLSG